MKKALLKKLKKIKMKKSVVAAAVKVGLVLLGVLLGVAIEMHEVEKSIVLAERECHAFCDDVAVDPMSNQMCKMQCTNIIVEARCTKFPEQ
jgi:hypothetical protein